VTIVRRPQSKIAGDPNIERERGGFEYLKNSTYILLGMNYKKGGAGAPISIEAALQYDESLFRRPETRDPTSPFASWKGRPAGF
jgi:hypothetical protein